MNDKRIYVFAKWQVKDGQADKVIFLLKRVAQKSWEEEGNLCYKINRCSTDDNTIILFEGYSNEASQKRHQESPYFRQLVLGRILPLLEKREVIMTTPI
ncbi:putative quinol monooxygenase [Mucilaginibacter pedocola]|uniref:ABM domain-containing protein n=1 Tax=Mucilaginibacter pedocola TaxID=1792845 RepID=A0A1S9P745_9SPHI|nr:antibiotic biosynthesis monooxygenase [Mucilaginibacter pedocola]OOQ56783.1 hypothetical protein BC343_17510 [Mucilaginibacter pedocola]